MYVQVCTLYKITREKEFSKNLSKIELNHQPNMDILKTVWLTQLNYLICQDKACGQGN